MSQVWSFGIYRCDKDAAFPHLSGPMVNFADSRRVNKSFKAIHTQADPFLITIGDYLYVLYEVQCRAGKGMLAAQRTADGQHWEQPVILLKEPYHLSYPFPFHDPVSGQMFLLPESSEANELVLYNLDLPAFTATKAEVLLRGKYVDSSLHFHNGIYYLFTTTDTYELHIYTSSSLMSGNWQAHPANPVSAGMLEGRNGGGLIQLGDVWYRIAQDCLKKYGDKIRILKVCTLSPDHFSEEIISTDFTIEHNNSNWKPFRRHHLSLAYFRGHLYCAMDGMHSQSLLARALKAIL